MKLHEKIKNIRQEKGLNLKELHRLIVNYFKEGAITYRTLQRIEAGDTDGKASSLHQISTALAVSLGDLKKGTEEETKTIDLIKRNKRLGRYIFNEKASADLLMRQNRNFMVMELVLKPQAKTKVEQDPELSLELSILEDYKILKFEKYIYCLKGSIACYIGGGRYVLKRGDGISFESNIPHWFENIYKRDSRCLIVQNPRYL